MISKKRIFLLTLLFILATFKGMAQFKTDAFSQNYASEGEAASDSVETMFSFKEYFGGLSHKNTVKIGSLFGGSTVFIGGQQIYNRQYWKLPFIYGGLGVSTAMGFHYKNQGRPLRKTIMFAASGMIYWATLLDGVANYNKGTYPQAGKATLYSLLLPGLGQIYNKEYWKLPIYWGGLVGSYHYLHTYQVSYTRFKRIHNEATTEGSGYNENISASTALYYRNYYRRYRDYAIVALVGFYLLQAIDANVFASMHNFDVDEDISLSITPTLITPDTQFAINQNPALGLSLGFRF